MNPPPDPIRLTITDLTQTREDPHVPHMHWPVDPETTRRLRWVIAAGEKRLPWYRRLIRLLSFRNLT